jgi:hypothetical protein
MPNDKKPPTISKAIRTAKEQLAKMPSSADVSRLRREMGTIEAEVDGWSAIGSSYPQRERVMQRLAIHLAITTLARAKL